VKGVVALPPRDLLLIVERPADPQESGEHLRLRLSASPDLPRIFLQTAREKRRKGPLGPFFRAAEELAGARITALSQVGGDRIARIEFAGREPRAPEPRALVLELTGRHANLVLLDGAGRVAGALVPPPPTRSGEPGRLAQGQPWRPPGGSPPPTDTSPPLAEWLRAGEDPGAGESAPDARAPLSWLVERGLGGAAEALAERRAAAELARRLERKLARARSHLAGLEQRAAAAEDVERVREDGELLKANLEVVARGARSVEVDDFFAPEGGRRRIELDPKLRPSENVERLFARYRKLSEDRLGVQSELGLAAAHLAELEALLARLGTSPALADELEAEAIERGLLTPAQTPPAAKRAAAPAPRLPYRAYRGGRGSEIRVGRSARDNDDLTLHHSKGSDLWLHTADAPGSHVVLCLSKGAEADPEEVLDAAHLAVHFSPLRGARKADVHVAPRKLVHKPKGAKPGLVTLSGGKLVAVRLEPERLGRLLGASRPPPADSR
jgi:predicted ribosome quality control (RQC) complex YloA/Tae2 family protein